MKTISKNFRIITYGRAFSELNTANLRQRVRGVSVSRNWAHSSARGRDTGEYLLVSSKELDDAFSEAFRENATKSTRLLVVSNERISADRLASRIVDLQIRTTQRFYVIQGSFGVGKMAFLHSLIKRLRSALEADDNQDRILDARIEDGVLHVVSPNFNRLDVPITQIPEFKNIAPSKIQEFEIDEDGSFIYWPKLDLHLGWSQLEQLINPDAALRASQKSQQFNERYGNAVQRVREQAGLKPSGISGISEKQLRRIESGQCRVTSNAIEVLSRAHKLAPNEYMKKLAEALA